MALDSERVHERRWWILAVLCITTAVISTDNTILNVALPHIVRNLGASGAQLQWIIDAYILVFAGLLLTMGAIGDKFGRKGALTAGLLLFATFSSIASQATSPTMLIVCRGLMGIGSALMFPATLSILTNIFSGRERARAIGFWAMVNGLGVAMGPLIGGFVLEHFWWGAVFLVNVPLCLFAVVAGYKLVPKSKDPDDSALDVVGAVLSIVALVTLLYGIIEAPVLGWTAPNVVISFVLGLTFLALFITWELKSSRPMLDVRFFKNMRFTAASAAVTLVMFSLFGTMLLLTQYYQFVLSYSPFQAGLVASTSAIGLMAMSPQAPKLAHRYGTKIIVVIGLCTLATAVLIYTSHAVMSSYLWGCIARVLFGVGMGLTIAPATESIMGALPRGKAGVGSAVNDTTRQAGGALGVAVVGSIVAWRYRSMMQDQVLPAGADAARDSVGKAIAAASQLTGESADAVRQAATESFLSAMTVAYVVAAIALYTAAVLAWKFLPARAVDHDEPERRDTAKGPGDQPFSAALPDGLT